MSDVPKQPEGAAKPLSVFLLARSLVLAGSERQLVTLAIGLHERGHNVRVGVFYAGGPLEDRLKDVGVPIVDLGKSHRWDTWRFLLRTASVLHRTKPDIMYSFLGAGNVVAAVVKPFARSAKLIWSVRNTGLDPSVKNLLARFGNRLENLLSRSPSAIIANSSAGREFAVRHGFPPDRMRVVHNGIDTERFKPDPSARSRQRKLLGIRDHEIVVGVLARLNSTKGYPTFIRAAALVARAAPNMRFLCVGGGGDPAMLQELARDLGVADQITFSGDLDANEALNAFDIACSPSVTEGFSNAIAEAMACGLPCIVTDVGDSAAIVGALGTVVPANSPEQLATAILTVAGSLANHDPAAVRQRVIDNYTADAMVEATLDVFHSVLGGNRG